MKVDIHDKEIKDWDKGKGQAGCLPVKSSLESIRNPLGILFISR